MKHCLIFFREEGVPTNLIVDCVREQVGHKVQTTYSEANCGIRQLEFETP